MERIDDIQRKNKRAWNEEKYYIRNYKHRSMDDRSMRIANFIRFQLFLEWLFGHFSFFIVVVIIIIID